MPNHMEKATKVADQIAKKVADTLDPLRRQMDLMKWPPEFRVIMWEAVSRHAALLAVEERLER